MDLEGINRAHVVLTRKKKKIYMYILKKDRRIVILIVPKKQGIVSFTLRNKRNRFGIWPSKDRGCQSAA